MIYARTFISIIVENKAIKQTGINGVNVSKKRWRFGVKALMLLRKTIVVLSKNIRSNDLILAVE